MIAAPGGGSGGETLLLVNADCCGHFLVYCNVLAEWALARGLRVDYLGPRAADRTFMSLHEHDERVRFLDAGSVPAAGSVSGEAFSFDWICGVERLLRPRLCVLLNGDALLFESMELLAPGARFPVPTWAVATFAYRDRDTCFEEPYTARLAALSRSPGPGVGPFAGLFTLDERHARACAPQAGIRFLPDMYRDFVRVPKRARAASDPARERDLRVRAFLNHGEGPVLPLLGKFDRRKNPLWGLRLAAGRRDMAVVILGERVADPDGDGEIDALLEELRREGRVFVHFGYVPEALFDVVLRHPRVRVVPLPYQCHFGSSGIQLMAHRLGKPVLVADQGLMACRVRAWRLGRVFRPGGEADFRRQYEIAERVDARAAALAARRFMRCFSQARVRRALDVMLDAGAPGVRPPRIAPDPAQGQENLAAALFRKALDAVAREELDASLRDFDASLALEPSALDRVLRKGIVLWRLGRLSEAGTAIARARRGGLDEEVRFFVRLAADHAMFLARSGAAASGLNRFTALLAALSGAGDEAAARGPEFVVRTALAVRDLPWGVWRSAGDVLVHSRLYDAAARCYERAWALAPGEGGLALSASDVLRYDGRAGEALALLDRLAARSPGCPGLWCKRGQALAALGRIAEALEAFGREPAGSPFAEAAADHARHARESGTTSGRAG